MDPFVWVPLIGGAVNGDRVKVSRDLPPTCTVQADGAAVECTLQEFPMPDIGPTPFVAYVAPGVDHDAAEKLFRARLGEQRGIIPGPSPR